METQIPVRQRRTHTAPFKRAVIDACQVPSASVAGVALTHGVNANQARRWMREWGVVSPSRSPVPMVDAGSAFASAAMPPAQSETGPIVIEVRRGTTAIHVEWPVQTADACTACLRDWLRITLTAPFNIINQRPACLSSASSRSRIASACFTSPVTAIARK